MIYRVFVDKEKHDGMENHRCGYIHIDLPQLYRVFVDKENHDGMENHRCGYIHIDLPELYKEFVDKENHDGMENHRCGYNLSSLSYKAEHNVHSPFDSHPI
jgi:hypothetical protein